MRPELADQLCMPGGDAQVYVSPTADILELQDNHLSQLD